MKNLLILLLFATTSYCKGELPDYYVFLVKGEATVTKPGVKPIPIKQNSFIFEADIINLKNGAEVTLADKGQNFFVLRSPGIYNAKDVAKAKSDRIPGVTQTYIKLVWNELFNPNHDFTKFTKENIAGVYGGVSRGEACNNLIFPVRDLRTSGDSLRFKWHQTSPTSNYTLLIYDSEGKEVVNMAVKDTQKTLHITEALHSVPGNYYWMVKGENGGCEDEAPVYFELMTPENEQKLISSILPAKGSEDLAGQLQAITKLERNAMIPAARKYYLTMVNADPGNEALLKSFIAFLLKYSFDEEAYAMWQKIPVKK